MLPKPASLRAFIHWAAQGRPNTPTPRAMSGSSRLLVDTRFEVLLLKVSIPPRLPESPSQQ
eukprot:1083585-Amphidinium_carterae.1